MDGLIIKLYNVVWGNIISEMGFYVIVYNLGCLVESIFRGIVKVDVVVIIVKVECGIGKKFVVEDVVLV